MLMVSPKICGGNGWPFYYKDAETNSQKGDLHFSSGTFPGGIKTLPIQKHTIRLVSKYK